VQALVVAVSAFGCASASLRVRRLASVVEVPGAVAAMLLLPIPVALPPNKKRSGAQAGSFFVVEVPGIEPGSLGEDLVILRAQFALAFLCPDVHANKMSTGTVTVRFSVRTRDRFRW